MKRFEGYWSEDKHTPFTQASFDWPPRSEDGLHGATYEWDGPYNAVRCICGFYRIAESHEVAEVEYMNHVSVGGV